MTILPEEPTKLAEYPDPNLLGYITGIGVHLKIVCGEFSRRIASGCIPTEDPQSMFWAIIHGAADENNTATAHAGMVLSRARIFERVMGKLNPEEQLTLRWCLQGPPDLPKVGHAIVGRPSPAE